MKSVRSNLASECGWKELNRETESTLEAQFYANMMVKNVFLMQSDVRWVKRETYSRDIGQTRQFIILGHFWHGGIARGVEIHGDFQQHMMFPRWRPSSQIVLYDVFPKPRNVEWTSYSMWASELLGALS